MTEMSVSTQRLSAMIESLHDEKDDELLFMPRSANNSPPKKAEYIPSPIKQHDYLLRPPTLANEGSTASNHGTSLNGLGSPGNRESMISDYSASIHEGVPVSYIVSSAGNNFKSGPVRSTLNFISSQETVGLGISPVEEGEDSENSEEENNKTFAGDVSAPNLNPNSSLKLAVSRENTHQKAPSSIGSGNLASESGHSHNISGISGSGSSNLNGYPMSDNAQQRFMSERSPVTRIKEEAQNESEKAGSTNPENLVPQSTADVSVGNSNTSPGRALSRNSVQSSARNNGDDQSIVSSIIPPITTRVPDEQSRLKSADRAITADYKPSIPPRSKNRPKSHIFIKDSLEEIQHQLQQQLMLDDGGTVSRASTTKSGSYYSAADQANEEEFGKPDDDSYFHRPLPNIPQDNEEYKRGSLDRSGTLLVVPLEEEVLQTPPRLPNLPAMTSNNSGNENGNHDNFPPQKDATSSRQNRRSESSPKTPSGKSSSPQKSLPGKYSTPRKGKGKVKHSKNEMRSFDIDTISQLLSVTKGTLIGSEFANLGIRTEEKRALERLVDSLSRLTADMVLDPERYQEGLKRLDKATRALEGF